MTRIPRMTSKARMKRIACLAARTFVLSFAVVQAASSVIHGAGSWIVKPPAGTLIDLGHPLSANLVAAWHFDQSPVPTNLANSSLSGVYTATPTLVPTQDGFGLVTSDTNYLDVADPGNTLNFTTGPFSIGVDFYYGTPAPGTVIVGRDYFTQDGYDVQIANDGDGRRIIIEVNHGGTADIYQTAPELVVGAINRVVVTYDGSVATIFVNGVPGWENGASGAYSPPQLGARDLFIGRDGGFSGAGFGNPITRVLMWNRKLTPPEAAQVTLSDPYAYMAAPAVTQPMVYDVALVPITSNSAVINWTTNVPTDSFVQYGTTTAYGSMTSLPPPTTAHSMLISGLTTGQLYHFQVVSTDANGAIAGSPDSTFTPLNGMEFADDFVGSTLDSTSWIAVNRPGKSGEAQYYLPSKSGVGSGLLGLTSLVDASVPGYSYTSAMVQSQTFNFLYGSVEIRAKLPGGTGPWPGLRLLGANCQQTNLITGDNTNPCNWPQPGSDEIVIAEAANSNPFFVNQQIHSGLFNNGCRTPAIDVSKVWHTYRLVWTAASLEWKIDGVTTCTVTTGVPSTPMFLVLDVALGSGAINDATLPQAMAVDYVRVAQQTDTIPPTVAGVSPVDGAIGVMTSMHVTATFDESMAPASINASSILLSQTGVGIPAAVSYDGPSQTATLTPLAPLAYLTTYTATVKAGPAGVADVAGNTMPGGDIMWTFTTAPDTTPPVITAVKAAPGSNTALITWTTDKLSTSRVDFGMSAQSLTLNVVDSTLVTAHSVVVSGLTPKTTYYFRVTCADASSNNATVPTTSSSPASFVTNPAGLVVAFGFNEGTGAAVIDSSNTGNNGVINGATWTNGGRYGKALSFDGTSATITVAEAPSLDLTTGMTIEAWVKPVSLTGWQSVIYKERPDDGGTSLAWALYSTDYTAPPAVYGMLAGAVGGNQWTHAMGVSMLRLNAWSHLAGTFDGTALRLYVNGVLAKTLSLPGSLVQTPGPLRIGGHSTIGQFFNGLIDEVRVYNRALSKSEIQGDMNSPLP
jgi:beta-glucanase (GH16 family)